MLLIKKQMKNRFDNLKANFGAFLKLRNKLGNVYNPTTNTFNLTDEEWDLETKVLFLIKILLCMNNSM